MHHGHTLWRRVLTRGHAHTRGGGGGYRYGSPLDHRRQWQQWRATATGIRRSLQTGGPSRPVRGRVCHCTGTRAAAKIHSPPLVRYLSSYPLARDNNVNAELNCGAGEFNSLSSSLVRASFTATRVARFPHGLIDARTAPLTTPSLRRRVSILYGSDERRAHAEGENNPTRRAARRAVGWSVGVASTVARAPLFRCPMIHLARAGETARSSIEAGD